MTRSPSSFSTAFLFCLAVGGCGASSGVPVAAITEPQVAQAYIPLGKTDALNTRQMVGAAFAIAPGIAVTNGHNRNLLDPRRVIGEAADYDLLFFHTADFSPPLPTAPPQPGLRVTAYGQGSRYDLRHASGVVREITPAPGGGPPAYFTFSNNKTGPDDAGPGFSGGPVLDAQGRLVGIVFGFKDDGKSHQRLIYAYDMARVRAELSALQKRLPPPQK